MRIEKRQPKVTDVKRKIFVVAVAEKADFARTIVYRDCPDLLERKREIRSKWTKK